MGGKIYSIFFYNYGISMMLVLFVTLFVTRLVGYLPIFLVCSGLTVISFVLMLQFTEESPWKADTLLKAHKGRA